MDGGYPTDVFTEPIADQFVCKLCTKVLRSPKTAPCGHVFCKGCIDSWIAENKVCPQGCCKVEGKNLAWAVHIATLISGLKTRCQNAGSGCSVVVPLAEKLTHELSCPYGYSTARDLGASREPLPREAVLKTSRGNSPEPAVEQKESLGFFQRTKLVLSFRSRRKLAPSKSCDSSTESDQSRVTGNNMQRTYRLKRNRPKEPLGLVLVSGDKTSDGRHKSYYVRKVNRDTLGWRAGIMAGDRIIKVDNHALWHLTPQESMARIKEKTVVTLTVLREMGGNNHPHIYDEIITGLSQQNHTALSQPLPGLSQPESGFFLKGLSQCDENHPPMDFSKFSPKTVTKQQRQQTDQDSNGQKSQRPMISVSPGANLSYRTSPITGKGERTSKDSGLSSGSSDSPNSKRLDPKPGVTSTTRLQTNHAQDLDREITARRSYRTEQEMVRDILKKEQRKYSPAPQEQHNETSKQLPIRSRNRCIVGDYEFEDISLEKNGTSQLGITLGYDSSGTQGGCLYVCEIVPGGLAASDGRLRTGDIIKRVNGFQVFDPEEAILMFLEQDQDIKLSVARKIKAPSRLRSRPEADLSYLESTLHHEGLNIRKVDSCGSLDTGTYHHYAILEPPWESTNNPVVHREKMSRSRDLQLMATSQDSVINEDDVFHSRRGSTPSHANPLGSSSRKITGSSPNLLNATPNRRSPPIVSHQRSGSHLPTFGVPMGTHNKRRMPLQDGSPTVTPDSKHYRPLVHHQRKHSTPSPTLITPLDHEPIIMVPPSPSTQVQPSFRGVANDIRRLPNRFENTTSLPDPNSAATQPVPRESLV